MKLAESENLELKKSTAELKRAVVSVAAILNKSGKGRLYFGMKDDGTVVGQSVSAKTLREVSQALAQNLEPRVYPKIEKVRLAGKQCIKVTFAGKDSPYLAYGRVYIRVADEDRQVSRAELARMFLDADDESARWESAPSRKSLAAVNQKVLKAFVKKANEAKRIHFSFAGVRTTLNKLGLLSRKKLLRAGEVLFCGNNPLEVQAAVFAGTSKRTFVDIKQFKGTAFELLEASETYLKEHLDWRVKFGALEREEIPEIPVGALREALVNSVCHRDYRNPKGNEVAIFKDRVEIYNPGAFPAGYTPEDFLSGRERSILRNPLLAETLFKSRDIEKWGSGLKRITDECAENDVKVQFEALKSGFLVTFKRDPASPQKSPLKTPSKRDGTPGSDKLFGVSSEIGSEKSSEKILALLRQYKTASARDVAKVLGLTPRAVEKQIAALKAAGRLERVGSARGGHWEVLTQ